MLVRIQSRAPPSSARPRGPLAARGTATADRERGFAFEEIGCRRTARTCRAVRHAGGDFPRLLPKDLLHGPALGQLIHELVQVTDVAHQRVLDLLDAHAADGARDLAGVWIEAGRLVEEGLEVALPFDLFRQRLPAVARQPADDLVHLLLLPPLLLRLLHVEGIDAGKGHGEDPVVLHGYCTSRTVCPPIVTRQVTEREAPEHADDSR